MRRKFLPRSHAMASPICILLLSCVCAASSATALRDLVMAFSPPAAEGVAPALPAIQTVTPQAQTPREGAATPVVFPKSPAGERARAFFEAFSSGEAARLEKFFASAISADGAKQTPPAARAARLMGLRRDLGAVRLRKVEASAADGVALYVEGEHGRLMKIELMFSVAPDYFLRGVGVDEASPDDLAGPLPPMSRVEALAGIEKSVAAAADEFSGVVLVAREGRPILLKAWGLANKAFAVPNRTDTKFNLGSINKIFTRIAIAQLIEQGKIAVDDKLGKFLPDYPNADARTKVTVGQLLDMRSGIGDFFGEKFVATPKDRFRTNADFLPMFADQPLAFEPGTQQRYSNGGYAVLGEIVARASGMDYYDYVRKNICAPAGMTNTDSYGADFPVENLAEGYTRNWGAEEEGDERVGRKEGRGAQEGASAEPVVRPRRSNIYSRPARGSAAGGGYSTAEDLLRFTNALAANKLLSPAYTQWVLTGVEPGKGQAGPGGPRGRGGLGIAGGAPGINAAVELDFGTGYTVIVLANYDPPAAVNIARKARRFLAAAGAGGGKKRAAISK